MLGVQITHSSAYMICQSEWEVRFKTIKNPELRKASIHTSRKRMTDKSNSISEFHVATLNPRRKDQWISTVYQLYPPMTSRCLQMLGSYWSVARDGFLLRFLWFTLPLSSEIIENGHTRWYTRSLVPLEANAAVKRHKTLTPKCDIRKWGTYRRFHSCQMYENIILEFNIFSLLGVKHVALLSQNLHWSQMFGKKYLA